MTASSTNAAAENKPRGIILVEPYDALGIAISSALHKFASLHQVRAVPTLAAAETAAANLHPELFVIDLDPPSGDEVRVLNRLREEFPQARALVIAPGHARELRAFRGTAGAVQFIEKPFDLGAFGAAVQALLGPWAAAPAAGETRGTLRNLHVLDITQVKCLARSSARLGVESESGNGEIFFQEGEIVHAASGALQGVAALKEIVCWPECEFSEEPLPENFPRSIDRPWQALLSDAVEKAEKECPDSLGKTAALEKSSATTESLGDSLGKNGGGEKGAPAGGIEPPPRGKRILVIDDTEMLLIFAADVLRTADRSLQIVTATSAAEGLRLAHAQPPDLILLDYSLSDSNGGEVCRALLGDEATAHVPVLMMSGHLPELAEAAAAFGNIVATLPKPFLSGALINAVEKIFAADPLPQNAPLPNETAMEPPATAAPAPAAPILTEDDETSDNGSAHPSSDTPPATLVAAPPAAQLPRSSRQPLVKPPAAVAAEHREVIATLACEVVSVQLAPDFRAGALQLKPAESGVVLRMNGSSDFALVHPEKDFRIDAAQLNQSGTLTRLRLLPAAPAPHPSTNGNDFAVEEVSAQSNGRLAQLTDTQGAGMRVKLIVECELRRVELSDAFAVVAVVLQPKSDRVQVQAVENNALAMQFFIHQVQLDESGQFAGLRVGSRR